MRTSLTLASALLLACGAPAAPPVAAPVVAPSARRVDAPAAPLPLLAAGAGFTCLLYEDSLRCLGAVPAVDRSLPFLRHELSADLLAVGEVTYCAARTGERTVRCFGEIYREPGDDLYEEWYERCGESQECIEDAEHEWASAPLELTTTHPIEDLDAEVERVCAVAGDEVVCWDLGADEPGADPEVVTIDGAADVEVANEMVCVRTDAGDVHCTDDWGRDPERWRRIHDLPAVDRIRVEGAFACGWSPYGAAHCWGGYLWLDEELDLHADRATRVPALDGVREMSASSFLRESLCMIDRAGLLRCFGDNRHATLGPITEGQTLATPIDPGIPGAVRVATGGGHACALDAAGALFCWGRHDGGAFGEERMRRAFGPVEVPGVRADAIAAFGARSCARTAEGWTCWGTEHGSEATVLEPWRPRPTSMPRSATPIGFGYEGCVLEGGSLRCGSSATERAAGVRAIAGESRCLLGERGSVTCAVRREGHALALEDLAGAANVVAVAGGGTDVATLSRSGELTLFGARGTRLERLASAPIGRDAAELAMTDSKVCVRRTDGSVWCSARYRQTELARLDLPPIEELAYGRSHVCARTRSGEVYCWGSGSRGELGVAPDTVERNRPVAIAGVTGAAQIAAGTAHTCARLSDGRVLCWGADAEGQLGARPEWWHEGAVELPIPD
jgi:hypothetical protein